MGAGISISVRAHAGLTGLSADDHPYAKKASNGSDFANAGTVRTNLGLGTAATASLSALVPVPGSPPAFTLDGGSPAAGVAIPAAMGTFTGLLLADALTAINALYARVDLLTGLLRTQVERDEVIGIGTVT